MEINIKEYLNEDEIKDVVINELRAQISGFFVNEKTAQRLLSNLAYEIVFQEVDKVIENSKSVLVDQVKGIINDTTNYSVFRFGTYGDKLSLAAQIMEDTIKENKHIVKAKVIEAMQRVDIDKKIINNLESAAEEFTSSIYDIASILRENHNNRPIK